METMRLQIDKLPSANGGPVITRLEGKLSLETVSNFLKVMRAEPAAKLVLDMSGLSFVDSAGVGALVQLFVHRRNAGQGFALAALSKQGVAVMQVSGLLKLLPIFPTVESAIAQQSA
jgi:anti-anti-sigma factor